jgi:uncharacterized membrane protein YkvA (DUF1232 family)
MARRKRSQQGIGLVRTLNMLAFLPVAGRAPMYGRLLWALVLDPRVPASRKALLGAAAVYVVSPIDLIPERIPILGALDDVAVVVIAVDLFFDGLPRSMLHEKMAELGIPAEELEADLRKIRRLVPKPLRRAAARLPDAIEGVAEFARERGLDHRLREFVGGTTVARPAQPVGATEESPA